MERGTRGLGMGGHHEPNRGQKDEWLTPPWILEKLGPFDLDPCAPVNRPWDTAKHHYTIEDDGLSQPWSGRVWCNPPYGPDFPMWLNHLADHGRGTALIFARTETTGFFEAVWQRCTALLFLKGRLFFHHVDGTRAAHNSGAPSVLVAYGEDDARVLSRCGIEGAFCAGLVVGGVSDG